MLTCSLFIFVGEGAFQIFCPFFNWIVRFGIKNSLYVVNKSLLGMHAKLL